MTTPFDQSSEILAKRGRPIQGYAEDTYKLPRKLKEPAACSQCGAVFHKGRWTWAVKPKGAHDVICPACHRIADFRPQGEITLSGPFLTEHKQEVLGLIDNIAALEKTEHPFARIMSKDDALSEIAIETTDLHLPRRIGEALRHAYQGELTVQYDNGDPFIRVKWQR